MNRRRGSLASSPLLIGAVTTLIVVVAVFLSYNANNGLPFVPTYNLKVALPEASGLQKANQVRIAGSRVGIISSLGLHQNPKTGRVTAIADLKLEKSVEPLPVDTKAIVQSVSAIGLKYLELEKGSSRQTLKAGATIPVSQTREPVDIDEFFNMFDQKTRTANQVNLNNFGDGVAGRGLGLNQTISTLRPLLNHAVPVLHNLASPQTGLRELFIALDRAASQTAPVAQTNAEGFSDLDTFFTAFASVAPSLEQAIVGGPPALEEATHSFISTASFVNKSAEFMHLLRPSASGLSTSARPLGNAIAVGAVNLSAATALNTRLASAAQALRGFAQNPVVNLGLEDLAQTAGIGTPIVAGLAPEQAQCNYLTLALRNFASSSSENVGVGSVFRASPVLSPDGPNNEGYPSSAPANGPSVDHPFHSSAIIDDDHLHVNPYPNVSGPGQPAGECEAGNENYLPGKAVIGNVPGSSGNNHEVTSRNESLFGAPYSSATLKALGLTKPTPAKPTAAAKGKSKKTAKKKGKKQ
jgi:virulence factor Mce-like protein